MHIDNSWSHTLEETVQEFVPELGDWRKGHQPVEWAPPSAAGYRAYEGWPVVLIVATLPNRWLHAALFSAVEVLQEGTSAFRTVVFCDVACLEEGRRYDFIFDSCFDEWNWLKVSNDPWLEMATERLRGAVGHYEAQHVVAVENEEALNDAVDGLARRFRAAPAVHMSARAAVTESLEELSSLRETEALSSLRGAYARELLLSGGCHVSYGDVQSVRVRYEGSRGIGCYIGPEMTDLSLGDLGIARALVEVDTSFANGPPGVFNERVWLAAFSAVSEMVAARPPRVLDFRWLADLHWMPPAEARVHLTHGKDALISTSFGAELLGRPEGMPDLFSRFARLF